MKIVDFHCDTISQLYDLKQSGENINLKENKLHLDLNKMKKSDYMLQVFASYVDLGSNNKPLELFEKKVNPNLKSDVKIELGSETIIINYKNESLQFTDLPQSSTFNNPYVYMGLQKALYRFIVNNSEDDESVDLEEMEPPNDGLDFKLYNLMRKKKISELNIENIDEVIYSISDKMLEKYTAAVRRLYSNGN